MSVVMNTPQKPPHKTWLSEKIEIHSSPISGCGMFAAKAIDQDEVVLIWGGTYANEKQAVKAKGSGKLVMQWDEDLFSIENRGEDQGYFLNHSCDPNVWMNDAYTLSARQPIAKGEEITADYALWEANEDKISAWDCHCQSRNCRKKITGKDWEIPELQTKYRNHLSPLLNKRIANKNICKTETYS